MYVHTQRCNRGEFWCDLCDVGAESVPPGWNRVKVSENLGATTVASVAPAVMNALSFFLQEKELVRSRPKYCLGGNERSSKHAIHPQYLY